VSAAKPAAAELVDEGLIAALALKHNVSSDYAAFRAGYLTASRVPSDEEIAVEFARLNLNSWEYQGFKAGATWCKAGAAA
jgi:hypothetical protein